MDIYVGNLPYAAGDSDLKSLFEKHGAVASARVVMDRFSGQSKGFGFVEMPNQEEAINAIKALNGSDFMGRPLRVNESRPKERERGGDRRREHRGGREQRW